MLNCYELTCINYHKPLSQGSWEKKLIERVHNVRSAQSRKRPPPDGEMSTPKKGRPKSSAVLNRYPPLEASDFGNDDVSNAQNLHLLQKEMERDKPRKDTILPLLRQTFASRRVHSIRSRRCKCCHNPHSSPGT